MTENNRETPLEIALAEGHTELLALLAQYIEFPDTAKMEYLKLMMTTEKKVSLEEFKKQLQSFHVDKVGSTECLALLCGQLYIAFELGSLLFFSQLKKETIEFEEQSCGLHLLNQIGNIFDFPLLKSIAVILSLT